MSYKIEIQNNFFVVTDTATGIEEIREVRDEVKWRVSGSIYSFFYNIPNLVDQNSPNIIRLGENAKEFDFSEIVDSTEMPFASREIFNTLLNENLGFIIRETSSVWGLITGDINDQTDLQTILNGKFDVPTGDTTQYIAGDGTLITFPVAGQAGTLVREVKNMTGATLTKGTIVYINGANGNKPTVAKALATSDATSAQTFGFLQSDIPNNSVGFAVAVGDLTGLDTSAITEGTQLYLSSTVAGEYTTTKQVAPAHLVYVGIVTRSHPTQGQIEVKIQNGYELDELHDVLISGETDGQVLQFESASGLWKNKTLSTGLTVGSTAITGGVDGRVLFQNGGVVQESANLFWDNTNGRLGVGTSSPSAKLHVNGNGIFINVSDLAQLSIGSATSINRIMPYTTGVPIRFLNTANGLANIGAGAVSIGSSFGGTLAPTNGAIIEGNVSIGQSTNGARLDVRAQGALSTDLAFRIRNSTDTDDLINVRGNGNIGIGQTADPNIKFAVNGGVRVGGGAGVGGQLIIASGSGQYYPSLTWVNNGNSTQGSITGYGGGLYTQNASYFQFTSVSNVTVGGGYGGRDNSAILQANSTTKGFLPPRMTNAERTAIATPAVGLMVYCTDATEGLYIYKSTGWTFVI